MFWAARNPAKALPTVECAVCGSLRDWLVIGWDEQEAELRSWPGTHAMPAAGLIQTELTVVCRRGHGMTLLCHGRPAAEVLAFNALDCHVVAAFWASVAGGKTTLAKRIMRIIVPSTGAESSRRAALLPMFAAGLVAAIPLEVNAIPGPTFALSNATCRKVLETYVRERIDSGTKASDYVDHMLIAAGETVTDSTGAVVANPRWGDAKHPLVTWHEVDRDGSTTNLVVWILDEAGELHDVAAVDRRAQQATLQASEADVLTWVADVAISQTLLSWVARYPDLLEVVRESYRPKVVGGVRQVVDLNGASSERQLISANALTNTIEAASAFDRPVGVVVTKVDLVAQCLRRIEHDPATPDLPLRTMLGEAGWTAAVDLARRGMRHLAAYWLEPGRVAQVEPSTARFLRDLVLDRSDDAVGTLVASIATHYGTADSFWSLVNKREGQVLTLPDQPGTQTGTQWPMESIDDYRDRVLALDPTRTRITMRDVVCTVMGRILVASDYDADHIDALCPFVPETYFLVSLLTDPFVSTRAELEHQLKRDSTATTGLKHLFFWLVEPALRGKR